jgi:serine/threonine protein kinase/Tol biopolymer transport system component
MVDRSLPEGKAFGHYRIQGRLGAGGMGVVYSAYDTLLERKVAIKVVGDRVLADKSARNLLLHEARAASALNHPNICTIHQVGDSDGEAYIVMEQVEGPPLSSLLATGGLSPDLVIRYGMQIADALAHAHKQGVIHRDLKSTNALVTPEGRVKVLDFGLATRLRDAQFQEAVSAKVPLTQSRMIVGTLPYLAPELLRAEPADARTDIWALGILLYEMASGMHPFQGCTAFELSSAILRDPPTQFPTCVPLRLGAVILRCLEKSPGDRYQRASEVGADLQRLDRDIDAVRPEDVAKIKPADPELKARTRSRLIRVGAWTASIVALPLAALLIFRWLSPLPPPRVLLTTQLTHFAHATGMGGIASDGARIFFLARDAGRWDLMQVPVSGGEAQPFPSPFRDSLIMDVSPDRSEFLVASFKELSGPFEYWTLPVVGGSPRRLSSLTGFGTFSPDGQQIGYHNTDGIHICSRSGSDPHRLVSLSAPSWGLAWSPDGKTLSFTVEDQSTDTDTLALWEVSADGSNLHPVLPGWHQSPHECCGRWSADGRYYIFLSNKGDGPGSDYSVWARREKGDFPLWSKPSAPVRLTAGPISFGTLAPTKDGRRLLAVGGTPDQIELLRSTPDRKQFFPMVKLAEVFGANLAPKGDWLALLLPGIHAWTLWRSRLDGTERIQLASDFPGTLDMPRWSPDGTNIVFQGVREGRPWNIFVVAAKGGSTQELLPNDQVHEYPDWLPDGESIVYSTPAASQGNPPQDSGIFVLDLKTRKTTKVPASDGLRNPRVAFGGRFLAALSEDQKKVLLFDFQTLDWREIASAGKSFYYLESTRDGKYLYFQDLLEAGQPLYRVRVGDWKLERVMSFESLLQTGVLRCRFMGLTADGSPMLLATRGGGDVYALDLDLP